MLSIKNLSHTYPGGVQALREVSLAVQKHRVPDGVSSLDIVVDELPLFAGIDPYDTLIDRNRDDNIVRLAPP